MATETLTLDGIADAGSGWADSTPTVAQLNTDDTTYAESETNHVNNDCVVSFPTPTGDLNTGVNLQTFTAIARKSSTSGTGTPKARIELYEAGNAGNPLATGTDTDVGSGDTTITLQWNASLLTAISGVDVQAKLVGLRSGGSPSARAAVAFDYIKWDVDYSTAVDASDGSPALAAATASGTAQIEREASDGSPTLTALTASGTGSVERDATDGSPALTALTSAGTAQLEREASDGSPALAALTAAGTANLGAPEQDASGGGTLTALTSAGTAQLERDATDGSPQISALTSSGGADIERIATDGVPVLAALTAAGTAQLERSATDGSPTLAALTAAGTADLGTGGFTISGGGSGEFYRSPSGKLVQIQS